MTLTDHGASGSGGIGRCAGVLAHLTSIPSQSWPGTLGVDAYHFLDWLSLAGMRTWQMLPLGPPHANDSPYQCQSAHAGNLRLLDKKSLVDAGWLREASGADWLEDVYTGFEQCADEAHHHAFAEFEAAHRYWLDDYALYVTLKRNHDGSAWWQWPAAYRDHDEEALSGFSGREQRQLRLQRFGQFLFQSQWQQLRARASELGIALFGDMPIFVAQDSADVWAHRELFKLDDAGGATVVTGVPPDAFSETGQRWGNPHYCWERMAQDDFLWWKQRVRTELSRFDLIRVDHFRGFCAAWEIPAEEITGQHGHWQPAPGEALFGALTREFETLNLVAEDLGLITPDVVQLREQFAIPGMKVLQFAFDSDGANPYLPHNHVRDSVVYTGTHDNDTTLGWYESLPQERKARVRAYLRTREEDALDAMMRAAFASVSEHCIVPMQDLLGLGSTHRMNTPSTEEGNWRWQFAWHDLHPELARETRELLSLYGRS